MTTQKGKMTMTTKLLRRPALRLRLILTLAFTQAWQDRWSTRDTQGRWV
jgi:hypothetical protein